MIAIVSPIARERLAFSALCAARGWPAVECDSVHHFLRLLRRTQPRVVLTRHQVRDGFSDAILTAVAEQSKVRTTRVVVIIPAGTASAVEARLVALGADCVQRDPVRTDVLVQYLANYYYSMPSAAFDTVPAGARTLPFAGATLQPLARLLSRRQQQVTLTPREVELAERLVESEGQVVAYETLYSEILRQRFRGDTSNMRVLLGKLAASARTIGIPLRAWVEVIPKSGYRYQPPPGDQNGDRAPPRDASLPAQRVSRTGYGKITPARLEPRERRARSGAWTARVQPPHAPS